MSRLNHCAPTELWYLESVVSINISSLRDVSTKLCQKPGSYVLLHSEFEKTPERTRTLAGHFKHVTFPVLRDNLAI
jgi:hypothetical protein